MWIWSASSASRLAETEQDLQDLFNLALEKSKVDMSFVDGKRDAENQHQRFLSGASQIDGYKKIGFHQRGLAGDVLPWYPKGHEFRGDTKSLGAYIPIVEAVRDAAIELDLAVRWGGAWTFKSASGPWTKDIREAESIEVAHASYLAYKARKHEKPFIDMPHYELFRH